MAGIEALGDARYGMFVHANIASVPGFAPVHEYADWYWSHLEPKADVVLHPTSPLPEVIAWHEEHFGAQPFDAFIDGLSADGFDPDAYATLAADAGMRYVVHVTKHHDGFCWWDTAYTDRNSVQRGPKRDVVAELAAAIRARGLTFGTYYSLLDWAHPAYPDEQDYVDAYMRPQIAELVERFQPAVLWGDGHWGHTGAHWRADQIIADYYAAAERLGFAGAVNDRFFASHADFVTYEYDVPERAPDRPWELCRGLGYSFCWNRAERDDDYLDARQIIAMLVETVAKGGNLLLNIGPYADGSIPELQQRILRDAGAWVCAHAEAIHGSECFDEPGKGAHWYTVTPDVDVPRNITHVNAFDLSASPEPVFAALGRVAGTVHSVTTDGGAPSFHQRDDGLLLDNREHVTDTPAVRYRIQFEPRAGRPIAVHTTRAPGRIRQNGKPVRSITDALRDAQPGDVIEIGGGHYAADTETLPLVVGAHVMLRAELGTPAGAAVIDGGGRAVVNLAGDGAQLVGLTITGSASGYMMIPPTCVSVSGASGIEVRDCHLESIGVVGGRDHLVIGNVIAGGNVWLIGAENCVVANNYQHGLRWGPGIEVRGGGRHTIESNECRDDLCAIRVADSADVRVYDNRYETRWFGIHVVGSQRLVVERNQAWKTMRAVNIEGGGHNRVLHNLSEHCDTGVVVERDAVGTQVQENWLHDCRVGILCWDDRHTLVEGNAISAARDHAIVRNSEDNMTDNDLGGSDIWRSATRSTP